MSNPASDAARAALQHSRRTDIKDSAENETAHGTATFLTDAEANAANLTTDDLRDAPVLLGRCDTDNHAYARYVGDGHILTIAPTGAGKTAGAVMPNHFYPGSLLIIDPKGNVPKMGAKLREKLGQTVRVLDPWGVSGLESSTLNPFDLLDPDDENTIDDARVLAAGLIIEEDSKNRYFSDIARILVTGFLVHIVTTLPPQERNADALLTWAYYSVTDFFDTKDEHGNVLKSGKHSELMNNPAFDGWLHDTARLIVSISSSQELWGSVFSTLQRSLDFLRSPRMKRSMTHSNSGFRFSQLKTQPLTVYIVIPPDRLETYNRWLRLVLSQAIIEVSRTKRSPTLPDLPVLFILDEFPALQRLEVVETAIGLMRGYGMKLWPIIQDLSQLKDLYPRRWASFIANAGVLQVFNVNDVDTAEYISKRMGSRPAKITGLTVMAEDLNSAQFIGRPIMTPDEVMRLSQDHQLLFYQGQQPYKVKKLRHYSDGDLKGEFAPDPMR